MRSWFLWNALYPNVRRLMLRADQGGLLALVEAPRADGEDGQFSERALATCALGSFPSDVVVAQLAALLGPDETMWVRACAADALRRIGGPPAAAAVLPALQDEYWVARYSAVKTLESAQQPDALSLLAGLVASDSNPLVRSSAADVLGEARSDAWVETLEMAAKDGCFIVALGGLGGLGNTETPAALDALRRLRREGPMPLRPLRWLAYWKLRRALRRGGTAGTTN